MPGRLFEVGAADPRAALAAVHGLPGLLAVHLYGDIVRVLTKADDPEPIRAWLAAAGITAEVTPVAVDMETAFAFLAELGAAA